MINQNWRPELFSGSELREEISAVLRGETLGSERERSKSGKHPSVIDLITHENLDLMRLIFDKKPDTIVDLADMAGRPLSDVVRTFHDLARVGIVRVRHGNDGELLNLDLNATKILLDLSNGTYDLVDDRW